MANLGKLYRHNESKLVSWVMHFKYLNGIYADTPCHVIMIQLKS